MSDSVSLIVAVVILFLVFRWVLGSNATSASSGGNSRGGPANPRRRNVTPDMVEAVKNMFPDIPTAAIQADLAITGSVEVTCNKIITQGGLPIPSHILPREAAQPGDSARTTGTDIGSTTGGSDSAAPVRRQASSLNCSEPIHASLLQRYNLESVVSSESASLPGSEEDGKIWNQDSSSRQEVLLRRKQNMILEARRKFLEKQKQKQEAQSAKASPSNQA